MRPVSPGPVEVAGRLAGEERQRLSRLFVVHHAGGNLNPAWPSVITDPLAVPPWQRGGRAPGWGVNTPATAPR